MLSYFTMVVFAIGMYWANRQYKCNAATWGRPMAGLFGMLALLIALSKILYDLSGCHTAGIHDKILRKELAYTRATYLHLGEHLTKQYKQHRVLLIDNAIAVGTNKYAERRREIILEALEEAFDGHLSITRVEHLETPDTGAGSMPSRYETNFTAETFDAIVERNPEANMILSMIGLPMDWKDMGFWSIDEAERPKLVLATGQVYELKQPILEGYIHAVVDYCPDTRYDINDPVPDDPKEAFDKRYILVHADNVEKIAAAHQNMFMAEPD